MGLQSELKATLITDAEKAILAQLGKDALNKHPHLAALYAESELDSIMRQVKTLFTSRKKKGVTWLQVANVHNRVVACDNGTRLQDAQDALAKRKEELEVTLTKLETNQLTEQLEAKLTKQKAYREQRVIVAEKHLSSCKQKQDELDALLAKVKGGKPSNK